MRDSELDACSARCSELSDLIIDLRNVGEDAVLVQLFAKQRLRVLGGGSHLECTGFDHQIPHAQARVGPAAIIARVASATGGVFVNVTNQVVKPHLAPPHQAYVLPRLPRTDSIGSSELVSY